MRTCDVAIIGGGIVGMSTALALTERYPYLSVTVLEAEDRPARHQSSHNTGVLHSGIYCKPGTPLMTAHCLEGCGLLFRFCADQGVHLLRTGKVVIATEEDQLPGFEQLAARAQSLGLRGLRRLTPNQIAEYEPHVHAKAGLFIQDAGIVDFAAVTQRQAELVQQRGGVIQCNARVSHVRTESQHVQLETHSGDVRAGVLINCAGLQSDRVARLCGLETGIQIVPFQTVFHEVRTQQKDAVRGLVYTVPPAGLPYLGLHLVRTLTGVLEVVVNPAIVHQREGYRPHNFDLADTLSMWRYRGFWRMVFRHGPRAIRENRQFSNARKLKKAVESLLPHAGVHSVAWRRAGVHAQAVTAEGNPLHDLVVHEAPRMIHVLNAPSPAATACLSIGRSLAALAARVVEPSRILVAARPA